MRTRLLIAVAAACAAAPVVRADEPADVNALIALVRAKPAGMSVDEWRERRRDAARALGRIGDRRAVPALIEVVQTEQFDVVAEIAIEALGRLGDPRAADALRAVAADSSRDRAVRSAARRALRRIGVPLRAADGREPDDDDDDATAARLPLATGLLGSRDRRPIPQGPSFDDDVIAATERVTFSAGNVGVSYDTVRDASSLSGDVHASYARTVDTRAAGYRYGGRADVVLGVVDPRPDDEKYRAGAFDLQVDGEARTYLGGTPFFGAVAGAAGVHGVFVRNDLPGGDDLNELRTGQDIHLSLAVGRGRIVDVGEGLRLRRIEKLLAQRRVLGRPITADLAAKLLRTWWALRGEQGAQRRLVATVAILRDAGVLLGEPDAATTYELLQVLVDGQLDHRLEGLDARAGFTESFLRREDDTPAAARDGRYESVFAQVRFGRQLGDGSHELRADGWLTYRVLADEDAGEPAPWAARAEVTWRRFVYGEAWDPLGALEFAGSVGASDDGFDGAPAGSRVEARVGWRWAPARATWYRLSSWTRLESGELFVGATFEATWGLLDSGYVAGAALPGPMR